RFVTAFEELARDDRPVDMYAPSGILEQRLNRGSYRLPKIPPMRMLPRDAFLADTEFVKFKDSHCRICAETLSPYPPGIPVISPGEELTPEIIDYLRLELRAGVRIQGSYDDELKVIRVVK
ncbi:MAG TPA: hypothetical protein VK760_04400, partial [Candidatus Acidoferrales bacterium]|nr:hypothetical protein [Candidatus Acidoferrales bacterium]